MAKFLTPVSGATSSNEVFKLAMSWITHCDQMCNPQCAKLRPVWYPTRLIDIRALKPKVCLNTKRDNHTGSLTNGTQKVQHPRNIVKLVERVRDDPHNGVYVFGEDSSRSSLPNNLYTTLSHCWGQSQHYTLTADTAIDLKNGIDVERLPKTFRDAITFAAQIQNVGWIWIDSLCIYQGGGPESEKDWLHEAALMQRVYQESYLNISATASSNSSMGLYWERDCSSLWETEVNVNVDGIPGLTSHETTREQNGDTTTVCEFVYQWFVGLFQRPMEDEVKEAEPGVKMASRCEKPLLPLAAPELQGLRRCILIDTSYWDNLVNKAPVNTRAWVLQERLLAPRVLHFCKGSIAWECGGFTRAEGHPIDIPKFNLQQDKVLSEISFKGLDPLQHGKSLRNLRLRDYKEPDPHIPERDLYGFELWAHVVEMYSRLNLTMTKDKLVALSGIAQLMATKVLGTQENPTRYVAGLWYKYLESQLLWRLEPTFIKHNRTFHHCARRPQEFRAPSFSWASIDAQGGHNDRPGNGIIYGEVTDRDILIEVGEGENDVLIKHKTDNEFGIVTGGHIMVFGKLRRIRLSRGARGMFHWRLLDRGNVCPKLDKEKHCNVYLDAPNDDDRLHGIFESDNVYCLPAARGPRTEDEQSKSMFCLILQQAVGDDQVKDLDIAEQKGTFRRIGMTKLSVWGDKHAFEHILKPHATDQMLPHWPHGFDEATNRHLIRII